MATLGLKQFFEAFSSDSESVEIEVTDEIKVHNEIYNTEVDEVEGNATMVITVNGIVTQSIRPTTHEKKGYEIFGFAIEKIVLHGVSYTYSEIVKKFGEECLGDKKHLVYLVRDGLKEKYKDVVFNIEKAYMIE